MTLSPLEASVPSYLIGVQAEQRSCISDGDKEYTRLRPYDFVPDIPSSLRAESTCLLLSENNRVTFEDSVRETLIFGVNDMMAEFTLGGGENELLPILPTVCI